MKVVFYYLIFPGLLFTSIAGMLTAWVDRKVTARIQWRKGPPWYQNFADFFKLMGKELILPHDAKRTGFLMAPILGLSALTLASTILGVQNFTGSSSFVGDIIVVWYFLAIPSVALILGGSSSGNPLSSVGASREMKLILAYELPFLISILMVLFKTHSFSIGNIIQYQQANGPIIGSLSGVLGFIAVIFAAQAKRAFVPFDIPEAETEIAGGIYVEYSGPALGVFKLIEDMTLFVLPLFIITLFWGGVSFAGLGWLWFILKYVLIIVLFTLIRNTNPRVRIDQALKFFWGPVFILSVASLILSSLNL